MSSNGKTHDRQGKTWSKKLLFMLPVAVFLVFTLIFYGPLSLYLPNAQELWFGLGDVMRCILPFTAAALAGLCLAALVLPEKISGIFTALTFGAGLGLYLQGNLISIRYGSGVMDGTAIQWQHYTKYAVVNTAVWIACIILPFVLMHFLKKEKTRTVLIAAALFLTAIQVPALVVQLAGFRPNDQELTVTRDGIYELSDRENTILIILDTMDEEYYREFIEDHPEYTQQLTGFVHYPNTLAAAARTIVALPAMLTGTPFRREGTFTDYLKNAWGEENVLKAMHDDGVSVRVYSNANYYDDSCAAYVENFSTEGAKSSSDWILAKKLYKMTLSRFLPHLLKKYVWFNTAEFEEAKAGNNRYSTNNDPKFFREYQKNDGMVYTDAYDRALRVYHLNGAHEPHIMASDGSRVEQSDRVSQDEGCFHIVEEILNDLKENGHYDDATIILTADHGNMHLAEQPYFLIKQAGAEGDYQDNDAPLSLFDLPVILYESMGLTAPAQEFGLSLGEVDGLKERERFFFQNVSGSSRVLINEYSTTGAAGDYDAMTLVESHEDESGREPYELGTELSFKADATANRYCVEGFTQNTGFRTLMAGPYGKMEIPVADAPDKGELQVHISLAGSSENVELSISANGEECFHGRTDTAQVRSGLDFAVPAELVKQNEDLLVLEFDFPEIDEKEMEMEAELRTRTISLTDMMIQ